MSTYEQRRQMHFHRQLAYFVCFGLTYILTVSLAWILPLFSTVSDTAIWIGFASVALATISIIAQLAIDPMYTRQGLDRRYIPSKDLLTPAIRRTERLIIVTNVAALMVIIASYVLNYLLL